MQIIVVGCGRVGGELAYRLFRRGHQVAVVDQVAASFEKLHPDYRGRTIQGDDRRWIASIHEGIDQRVD